MLRILLLPASETAATTFVAQQAKGDSARDKVRELAVLTMVPALGATLLGCSSGAHIAVAVVIIFAMLALETMLLAAWQRAASRVTRQKFRMDKVTVSSFSPQLIVELIRKIAAAFRAAAAVATADFRSAVYAVLARLGLVNVALAPRLVAVPAS